MNVFHFVREALGLNQKQLANLLGVGLSLLKKAETNQRDLPSNSLDRLVWFYQAIQSISPEKEEPEFSARDLADLLQQYQAKLRKLEAEIKTIEKKNKQMALRQTLKSKFLMEFPESTFPQAFSQLMALNLEAEAHLHGEEKDALLRMLARKEGLQASISFLRSREKKF